MGKITKAQIEYVSDMQNTIQIELLSSGKIILTTERKGYALSINDIVNLHNLLKEINTINGK